MDIVDYLRQTAEADLYAANEIERLRKRNLQLVSALQWCSGSADFAPGGVARHGWLNECQPLIDTIWEE